MRQETWEFLGVVAKECGSRKEVERNGGFIWMEAIIIVILHQKYDSYLSLVLVN